ncbi:hypothetical protein F8568_034945 [Actinomadura sp. LD22]|uniref:Uncharacterized protein n=1 Tax=Actinomadura physcomitrii TaxID=2650748 RepID=A0A6I4MMZ3_9ACTN|nr:hypothetical protein [Actinomadura physcomitrii]MWA05474.1 hypothetical protein [Actinomadura physcomitrii]
MSNGARHGIGAVVGLVATAVLTYCLTMGAYKMSMAQRYFSATFRNYHGKELWIGAVLLIGAAIVLGLVTGSRVSPVASLIPGVLYTATGVLWIADAGWAMRNTAKKSFPNSLTLGYLNLATFGVFLLLGVALLVASVPPSRWRARTAAPRYGGPPPAPLGPPPAAGAPAPLGAPQAPAQDSPWGRPPQYGQQPPGQPQYGRSAQPGLPPAASPAPSAPPAQPPARPASGAVPFDDNDGKPSAQGGGSGEGVGEWTQMYGGDDLRRGDR